MTIWIRAAVVALMMGSLIMSSLSSYSGRRARAENQAAKQKGIMVSKRAKGTFVVKLNPQSDDKVGDPTVGRLSIDKQFSGELEGSSKGQMLAVRTEVESSAGYVAMERVDGKLNGLKGTFALQHSGTMDRGAPKLAITVVPDSGTDELAGLTGNMTINIVDGKHFYEFDYSLPSK